MRAEEQARYERRIFRSFVAAASLHVAEKSIRSRRAPHADISCRTREGSRLAFELVQIVDQGMAQDVRSQITLQKSLRRSCDTLARAQRGNLRKHLRDALVAVWFRERASRKVREASIPSIVAELEQIDASIEGDVPLAGKATLHCVVERLRISRGDFIGPCFYVSAGGSFADPLVERIQTKFSKSYEASAPLELLAFYELQPVSPEALWQSQLHEFVVQNLETSPFRRVWVYDVGNRKVRYVQP